MSTEVGRRPRVKADFATLVRKAHDFIYCAEWSPRELARKLGASPATLSRIVAALRRELKANGGELVSVRRGRRWHYEIRQDNSEAWARFDKVIASISCEPVREEDQDGLIYTYP